MNETPWIDDAARMILTGLIHSVWLGIVISGAYALVQRWT